MEDLNQENNEEEIRKISREIINELIERVENTENQKSNTQFLEMWVSKEIMKPCADDLSKYSQEMIKSDNSDLEVYQKGVKTQDKGINKGFERLIIEFLTERCKELHGIKAPITYFDEIISDFAVKIKLPTSIVDKLKPVSPHGKPEYIIINIDAKGCMKSDNDSRHDIFHCGNAQTSILKIISKERIKGKIQPEWKPLYPKDRWHPRKYTEIFGKQKCYKDGIPIITGLIKIVWDYEIGKKKYMVNGISWYIIPNGIILPIIKDVHRAPKDKNGEIRFHIHQDLNLEEEKHGFIELD